MKKHSVLNFLALLPALVLFSCAGSEESATPQLTTEQSQTTKTTATKTKTSKTEKGPEKDG